MKVLTVLGTRPEIIRLSVLIKKLDKVCEHILVHTGQNYDPKLSQVFFSELDLKEPQYILDSKSSSLGEQLSIMFREIERIFIKEKPDKVLILGDTNSGLLAIIAERMGIPVYHMEAGNRCNDLRVPEEKNRRIIDSVSTFNLPYTPNSRENLLIEGFPKKRIFMCGNPINEVISSYTKEIGSSKILSVLNLRSNEYIIATAHRAENVDIESRLINIFSSLETISEKYKMPVVFSCHPRTKDKLIRYKLNPRVMLCDPFGFFDFITLEKNCFAAITDSGTVQEECCLLKKPTITIRDTTERPETVACGSNIVCGLEVLDILRCFEVAVKCSTNWEYPEGYTDTDVSDKVIKYMLGKANV